MLQNVYLKINVESIDVSSKNISTGEIYFQYGELSFPEKKWNDFIDIILNWWIEELIQIVRNDKAEGTFAFMDGSFEVKVLNLGSGIIELLMINTSKGHNKVGSTKVSLRQLIDEFKVKSNEVIRYCKNKKMNSEGFERLKINVRELQLLG